MASLMDTSHSIFQLNSRCCRSRASTKCATNSSSRASTRRTYRKLPRSIHSNCLKVSTNSNPCNIIKNGRCLATDRTHPSLSSRNLGGMNSGFLTNSRFLEELSKRRVSGRQDRLHISAVLPIVGPLIAGVGAKLATVTGPVIVQGVLATLAVSATSASINATVAQNKDSQSEESSGGGGEPTNRGGKKEKGGGGGGGSSSGSGGGGGKGRLKKALRGDDDGHWSRRLAVLADAIVVLGTIVLTCGILEANVLGHKGFEEFGSVLLTLGMLAVFSTLGFLAPTRPVLLFDVVLPPITAFFLRAIKWSITPEIAINRELSEDEVFTANMQEKISTRETQLMARGVSKPPDAKVSILPGNPEVVQLRLQPGEHVEVEPGALCFMSPGVEMTTSLGEGNAWHGLVSGLNRWFSGESFFINTFVNKNNNSAVLGLTAPNPMDKIVAIDLNKSGSLICAKDAYLCSMGDVEVSGTVSLRSWKGVFFGGLKSPVFVRQIISGDGIACITGSGAVLEKELRPHQEILVHAESILALSKGIRYTLQLVGSPLSALQGREGCYYAKLLCGNEPGIAYLSPMQAARQESSVVIPLF